MYNLLSMMYLQACPLTSKEEIAQRFQASDQDKGADELPFENELKAELEKEATRLMVKARAEHDAGTGTVAVSAQAATTPVAAGYERVIESYKQVVVSLEARVRELEEGLKESPELRAEIIKLRGENANLREWLNAEVMAALANEKAAQLREKVHS
jgi:hypothetical protein